MKMAMIVAVALSAIILPAAAIAETPAERHACEWDAFRVCWSAIPDRHSVFLCLMNNKDKLSDACRTVMEHYDKPRETTGAGNSTSR
jgi:hypothetical protein